MIRKDRFSLWRVPVESGQAEPLGLEMENPRSLTVHPDGRQIAYCAGTNWAEIWVMENILPPARSQKK